MSDSAIISTSSSRSAALSIFLAGVKAADPYLAVKRGLSSDGQNITIQLKLDDASQTRTGYWSKIQVIAIGKAACAMSKAAQEIIPTELLSLPILAVTNYENVTEVAQTKVMGAGHPLPDQNGYLAAEFIAEQLRTAKKDELVLVLVSGGGSALIPYPVDGITLEEKIATTNLLLASGATINQINCVRKHLSQLKGGGFSHLAAPADLHAFILSDVLGDDLSSIASGPTVPDPTTYSDAIAIFYTYGIWDQLPRNVQMHLEQGRIGYKPETPKADNRLFKHCTQTLIGSNSISVKAALNAAAQLGYPTQLYDNHLCGEAKAVAETWVLAAKQLVNNGISQTLALVAGGETTVSINGSGRGGRNQEMALAFAVAAKQHDLSGNWTFLSGGTDGRDGPTDAAGGIVDQDSLSRMILANLDPIALLNNNDSYTALQGSQDLLITGATGTNVADLQVLLLHPTQPHKL
ncbi:MAG: glycerate kinase [Methylococcales bacterium]